MRPILLACLLLALPAQAQETPPTLLSLSETASRELTDDRYRAVLQGRGEGGDAAAAQAALNRLMREALEAARAAEGLTATTEGYWVQVLEPEGEPARWIARQSLRLEGADRDLMLEQVGRLQAAGLAAQELGSFLSADGHRAVRDELTAEALTSLRRRAEQVADTLGLAFQGFTEINIDGARPGPMPRAMMMEARTADAPVMTEGTSTASVTVTATARLVP